MKVDRGDALFVTDAPRRGGLDASTLEAFFEIRTANALAYLTPRFDSVPPRLKNAYLQILKSERSIRDVLIRKTLAESMRLHAREEIHFMNKLLERSQNP